MIDELSAFTFEICDPPRQRMVSPGGRLFEPPLD
jgi:hypothetical protein